jgi:hypothetical protein
MMGATKFGILILITGFLNVAVRAITVKQLMEIMRVDGEF